MKILNGHKIMKEENVLKQWAESTVSPEMKEYDDQNIAIIPILKFERCEICNGKRYVIG